MSTGLARDQIGGKAASSRAVVSGASSASVPHEIRQPVHRQHADAAAVGEDGQPLAGNAPSRPSVSAAANSSSRSSTRSERRGTPRRTPRRRRQRWVVGGRRPGAWRWRPDLTTDRLHPRRRPRRRHELARVVDGFDVEQDGAGAAIEREEVEQVAEVDVGLIAERDDCGKADVALRRPFDHLRPRSRPTARSARGRRRAARGWRSWR